MNNFGTTEKGLSRLNSIKQYIIKIIKNKPVPELDIEPVFTGSGYIIPGRHEKNFLANVYQCPQDDNVFSDHNPIYHGDIFLTIPYDVITELNPKDKYRIKIFQKELEDHVCDIVLYETERIATEIDSEGNKIGKYGTDIFYEGEATLEKNKHIQTGHVTSLYVHRYNALMTKFEAKIVTEDRIISLEKLVEPFFFEKGDELETTIIQDGFSMTLGLRKDSFLMLAIHNTSKPVFPRFRTDFIEYIEQYIEKYHGNKEEVIT